MTAPVAPPPSPEDIKARYGFVGQMATAIPELRGILDQATREQWTTDRFLMTVVNTNWWRTNGQAVREWQVLEQTDPQTARDRKGHIMGDIYARANRLGISLTPQQAEQAFYFIQFSGGMSQENIDGYLGRTFFDARRFNPQMGFGAAADYWTELNALATQYGMLSGPEQDQWLREQLQAIMEGRQSVDGARTRAIAYAKNRYQLYADRFDAGETVMDIARPRIERYRELLETEPTGGLRDPLVQRALVEGWDDQTYARNLRKDERWRRTVNARETVADLIMAIGTNYGYFKA